MAEVILSTPDLTVLGGPASVEVGTNVGPAGNRGVFVFFGLLNPIDTPLSAFNETLTETPIVFDLYILVDSSSPDYLQVYQYLFVDGVLKWTPQIKLTPNFYGTNRVLTFVDGVATLNINAFEVGLLALRSGLQPFENTRFDFSIQATLSNYEVNSEADPLISSEHLPAFVSVKVGDVFLDSSDNELKIPLTFYAAEFNGTSVQAIDDKNVVVHLSILIVSPNDVTDIVTPLSLPDNPINLTVLSVTTNSISVGWSAPTSGGIVEGYKVYILPYTTDPATILAALLAEPTATVDSETTSYIFTGLTAGTDYLVGIRSFNDEGEARIFEGLTPLILSNLGFPITTLGEVS